MIKGDGMFYVYVYLDTRKPGKYEYDEYIFDYEPFYVGKGKGNRYKEHLNDKRTSNTKKHNKIQKMIREGFAPKIVKINHFESENDAFNLEIKMIKIIGRFDNGGTLTNFTDGGEGISGYKMPKEVSEKVGRKIKKLWEGKDYREKNSKANAERVRKKETREKIRNTLTGRKETDEHKKKISQGLKEFYKNNEFPEHVKEILRESQKGGNNSMAGDKWARSEEGKKSFKKKTSGSSNHNSKKWRITSPTGDVYEIIGGLKRFCEEVIGGIHRSVLLKAMRNGRGIIKGQFKGWKLEEIDL